MITVSVVQKALRDVLQSIFEQAFGSFAMAQALYLLDALINIETGEVAPDIRNHDNGK